MAGLKICKTMLKNFKIFFAVFLIATTFTQAWAMSDQEEISIGRRAAAQVERQYGLYHDKVWEEKVKEIGKELSSHGLRHLPYTYKLINMDKANAFALPGGFIYVTKGILPYFKNDEELASVLAHETSHVELKHFQRMVSRSETTNVLAIIAHVLTRGAVDPLLQVASILDQLVTGPAYSRELETQADLNGIKLMVLDGRDPYAMSDLFHEFIKHSGDKRRQLLWFNVADHPSFRERIAAIYKEIAKYPDVPPPDVSQHVISGEVLLSDASAMPHP